MSVMRPQVGDPIFHPRFGFGTILDISPQAPGNAPQLESDSGEVFYKIGLKTNGTLFVPVARAETLGLRRLTNSLSAIEQGLASEPTALPANSRDRLAEVRACERAGGPDATLRAVRDLAASSNERNLSESERQWLDQACERLGAEAALVDGTTETHTTTVIRRIIREMSAPPARGRRGA